jgi:hypothetical protein
MYEKRQVLEVMITFSTAVKRSSMMQNVTFRYCSRSRRRAAKGDKRMVLVHTHGLFIT